MKTIYMPCPSKDCTIREEVSPEDPDASFSELWTHVRRMHSSSKVSQLMATVRLVDDDGNEIPKGAL